MVVRDINRLYGGTGDELYKKTKYGVVRYGLGFSAFVKKNRKEEATLGKLFCIQMMEELYKLGYDVILSSDLSIRNDQSTWFVRKAASERSRRKIFCIAPGQEDRLILLNHDPTIKNKVVEAIVDTWPAGIAREELLCVNYQQVLEIKMNGCPWWESDTEVNSKRLLTHLVGKMGEINMRFLLGTNIKGGTDTLFFIEDEECRVTSPQDLCIISLCDKSRMRLVDCEDMVADLRQTILQNGNGIEEEKAREHYYKFGLAGKPWSCYGGEDESIQSRRLIARIGETMLKKGWALTGAMDITRFVSEKSVLLYQRCLPSSAHFACIVLNYSVQVSLVDFPYNDQEALKSVISQSYLPGIDTCESKSSNVIIMNLNGKPWNYTHDVYGMHGHSLMVHLLSKAIQLGYVVVASADVSAKYIKTKRDHYPLDADTVYLCKYEGDV